MAISRELLLYSLLPAVAAFLVTAWGTRVLIPRLVRNRIVGRDQHRAGRPEVAEMGGITIFAGIVAGISIALAIATFRQPYFVRSHILTAALATAGIIAVIGIADDIITIRQRFKAFLPAFASLPLIAMGAGDPQMFVPGFGIVDLGYLYPLVIVPLAVTGAANATNMLAGWNGLEAGLGTILFGTLAAFAAATANYTLLSLALPAAAACLAFLAFDWHPARVFPGDVGTLTIGGTFAACVIMGNVEFLGAILMVPFVMDLAMKVRHRLPKTFAHVQGSKLVCPPGQAPKGLGQLFLRLTGGMTEKQLVVSLLVFEAVFAIAGLAMALYVTRA